MIPVRILRRRTTATPGFALIEALVGIAILGILTVAVTSLATLGTRSSLDSERRTVALGLATQKIEEIRGMAYNSVALTTSTPPGNLLPIETVGRNAQDYRVTTSIATVDDPLTSTTSADYKQATVTVGFTVPGGAVRDVTLSTYVTRPVSVASGPTGSPAVTGSPTVTATPSPSTTCLAGAGQLATHDYNTDGKLDLAIGSATFSGDGSGLFTAMPNSFPHGGSAVASANIVGDPRPDLISLPVAAQNQEDGVYALDAWTGAEQRVSFEGSLWPFWLAAGKFSEGNGSDVVSLGPLDTQPYGSGYEIVATMHLYDVPLFGARALYNFNRPLGIGSYKQIAVADLNFDALSDVVITGYDSESTGPDTIQILTFVFASPNYSAVEHHTAAADIPRSQFSNVETPIQPLGIALGDVDGDGDVDLLQGHHGNTGIVYRNNGTRFFSPGEPISYGTGGKGDVRLIDVNHDSKLDIVYTAESALSVQLGRGDGTFEPDATPTIPALPCGTFVFHMLPADFNGDGWTDVALTHPRESRVSIIMNEQGTLRPR